MNVPIGYDDEMERSRTHPSLVPEEDLYNLVMAIWQTTHHHRSVLEKSRIANTGPRSTGAGRPCQSGVKTPDTYSVPDTYSIIDDTNDIDTIPMTGPAGPSSNTSSTHHYLKSSNSHSGSKPSYSEVLRQ